MLNFLFFWIHTSNPSADNGGPKRSIGGQEQEVWQTAEVEKWLQFLIEIETVDRRDSLLILSGDFQNISDCFLYRLWGDHGQTALESARVCLINATATGTEILKNLILPGSCQISTCQQALQKDSIDYMFIWRIPFFLPRYRFFHHRGRQKSVRRRCGKQVSKFAFLLHTTCTWTSHHRATLRFRFHLHHVVSAQSWQVLSFSLFQFLRWQGQFGKIKSSDSDRTPLGTQRRCQWRLCRRGEYAMIFRAAEVRIFVRRKRRFRWVASFPVLLFAVSRQPAGTQRILFCIVHVGHRNLFARAVSKSKTIPACVSARKCNKQRGKLRVFQN